MTGSSKETLGQKAVARSQHSIRLVERNGVFERASRVENPDLTRTEARSASSVVNRLLSTQKHGLNARCLIDLPAVPKWSDFDDCHGKDCIFLQSTLSVRLNMSEPNNGQALSLKDNRLLTPKGSQARYTGEVLLRTRPRTYRKVVALLADPDWSVVSIAQACKVSENTIAAVRLREASTIEERKKTLTSVLVDVATKAAEQIECKVPRGSLRDVTVAMGVSTDKVLALQGQSSAGVQVPVVINMPSPEEREERNRAHRALDAIAALLRKEKPLTPEEELLLKVEVARLKLTDRHNKPAELPPIEDTQD